MREIVQSHKFKKDLKKIKNSGKYKIDDLLHVLNSLAKEGILEPKYKDHSLSNNWDGFRECHIKPDWLLIYEIDEECLKLIRTGSHSDLF